MYFENFSNFYYDFIRPDGTVDYVILKDITQNVRFKVEVLQNISLYEFYDMQDTDTPELISERFYGTAKYHWVIMIVNHQSLVVVVISHIVLSQMNIVQCHS